MYIYPQHTAMLLYTVWAWESFKIHTVSYLTLLLSVLCEGVKVCGNKEKYNIFQWPGFSEGHDMTKT